MKIAAVLLALTLAGCATRDNPYDTSDMSDSLEEQETRLQDMKHAELAERTKTHGHDAKALDAELSDWRAGVVEGAQHDTLVKMREDSKARITVLEAREADLVARPPAISADPLVDVRRDLARERRKLELIGAAISAR